MPDTAIDIKTTPAPAPAPREGVPDAWRSFRGEMNRLFDRFDSGFWFPPMRRMFNFEPFSRSEIEFELTIPAVDVTEDDKAYKIAAELPGINEKSVEVSLSGNRLTLKGEKRQEKEETNKGYHLSERCYGSFHRSFQLPEGVDQDKIEAIFAKGVPTITLPKTAEAQKQHKKIEVKVA